MSNPWDRPPQPVHGDLDDGTLFQWVGRVMSQWEHIEWQFARIHSVFAGDPDGIGGLQEYGAGTIFKERLKDLRYRARAYFTKFPNQDLEGEFDTLCIGGQGFAERRNEVAHGVGFPTRILPQFRDRSGPDRWALIPPLSMFRNYDRAGYSKYAYTSVELNGFVSQMGALHIRLGTYREGLSQAMGSAPGLH